MKQEASGVSENYHSEKDRQEYIANYSDYERFQLEYDNINKNDGIRIISKIYLNSLFGEWGQRCDLLKTKDVTTTQEFNAIVYSPQSKIQHANIIVSKLLVTYRDFETESTLYALSNVILGMTACL